MNVNQTALALLALTAIVLAGCGVQHQVQRVKEVRPMSQPGVYYSLPETVVRIEIEVKKVTTGPTALGKRLVEIKPGQAPLQDANGNDIPTITDDDLKNDAGKPYISDFATVASIRSYLGGIPRSTEAKVATGNVSATQYLQNDSDALFLVNFGGSRLTARDLVIELSEAGLIVSGSSTFDNKTVEYAVKTLEVTASLAGKAIGLAGIIDPALIAVSVDHDVAQVLGILVQLKDVRSKITELTGTRTSAMPVETFEKQLTELRAIEQGLVANFKTKKVETWTAVLEFVPETSDLSAANTLTVELMQLNSAGVLTTGDTGMPNRVTLRGKIPDQFKDPNRGAATTTISLDLSVVGSLYTVGNAEPAPAAPAIPEPEEVAFNTNTGFVYRMPVAAEVLVYDQAHKPLGYAAMPIAQFGPMVALPARPGGSTSTYGLAFHPNGGLKKAELSSAPPNITGAIGSVGTAGNSILDAIAARELAEAQAEDPINQLKREAEELKLRLEIQQLQSQLEAASPSE